MIELYTLITAVLMAQSGEVISAGVLMIYSFGFALAGGGTLRLSLPRRLGIKPLQQMPHAPEQD